MHPLLLCVFFSSMNSSTSSAIVWSASIPWKLMTVMTSWWQRVASVWYSFFCSKTNKVIKRKLKKKKLKRKRLLATPFLNLLKLPTTSCWSQQVFQTQLGCGVCKWLWQGTDLAGQWKTTDRRVISFSHEISRSELPVSCSYTYKY